MKLIINSRLGLAGIPVKLLFIIWILLFIGRKTFSYINIFGIYVIEFSIFFSFLLFLFIFLNKPIYNLNRVSLTTKLSLIFCCIFIAYNILIAIFSNSINFKGLIPGVYPFVFLLVFIFAINAPLKLLVKLHTIIFYFYLLSWLISFFVSYVLTPLIGTIEAPGWTYVYGVSLGLSFFLAIKNKYFIILFCLNFIFAILLFERASFFNFLFSLAASGLLLNNYFPKFFIFKSVYYLIFFFLALVFFSPLIINYFFDTSLFRFELDYKNILNFFYSIFSSNADVSGDLSGTRNHRLEMWTDLIEIMFSNFKSLFFGIGYDGEVLDLLGVDFRAPHNGFITIFVRGGLIGLLIYLLFLTFTFFRLKSKIVFSSIFENYFFLGGLVFFAFIGDALTGTILDSPFTIFLVYFHLALVMAISELNKI